MSPALTNRSPAFKMSQPHKHISYDDTLTTPVGNVNNEFYETNAPFAMSGGRQLQIQETMTDKNDSSNSISDDNLLSVPQAVLTVINIFVGLALLSQPYVRRLVLFFLLVFVFFFFGFCSRLRVLFCTKKACICAFFYLRNPAIF